MPAKREDWSFVGNVAGDGSRRIGVRYFDACGSGHWQMSQLTENPNRHIFFKSKWKRFQYPLLPLYATPHRQYEQADQF
jgi:hypothetical protein